MHRFPIAVFVSLLVPRIASAQAPGIPIFSIDWRGPTVGLPDTFTLTPITEGDLLAANALTPQLGPLPLPGIVESGGAGFPNGLSLPLHSPCVGHIGGTPCAVEVDALSHALDAMVVCPGSVGAFPANWAFSVTWRAISTPGSPIDVQSESVCADEAADVFQTTITPCGPTPPTPSLGNSGRFDGNGMANACGTNAYPGVGLQEATSGLPPGDNLDALDEDVPDRWLPMTTCTYFSLDSGFVDPFLSSPNSGSAVANGFVGGDVLMSCPGCAPSVYATAAQLGLDLGGADTDDLDAIALRENGIAGYQRSSVPYDWIGGTTDMLFFSVRRGSALVGQLDAFFSLPIEPSDILVPTGSLGSRPGIWLAGESLGLATVRSTPGLLVGDDLDALDVLHDPQPGQSFCYGDGTGTACPCGNFGAPGRGCGNSANALGGLLWANGNPSITNDTVHFTVSGLPGATFALLFQGTLPAGGGFGVVFGDGLRCVAGSVTRLLRRPTLCGNREYGFTVAGDPLIHLVGGVGVPQVMNYQVWYRNAATFCTTSTFNLTNGYRIAWQP